MSRVTSSHPRASLILILFPHTTHLRIISFVNNSYACRINEPRDFLMLAKCSYQGKLFVLFVCFRGTGFHYAPRAGFELVSLLFQPPKCWHYRCELPHPRINDKIKKTKSWSWSACLQSQHSGCRDHESLASLGYIEKPG